MDFEGWKRRLIQEKEQLLNRFELLCTRKRQEAQRQDLLQIERSLAQLEPDSTSESPETRPQKPDRSPS